MNRVFLASHIARTINLIIISYEFPKILPNLWDQSNRPEVASFQG